MNSNPTKWGVLSFAVQLFPLPAPVPSALDMKSVCGGMDRVVKDPIPFTLCASGLEMAESQTWVSQYLNLYFKLKFGAQRGSVGL